MIGRLRLSERNHEQVTADLVALGYLTGARVGALLKLTQADLWRSPTGEVWVFVEEKARPDRRPVRASAADFLLPGDCTAPSDVSIWRIRDGRVLTYHPALRALARGCASAGLEPFTFHRLRHAFARDIAPELGTGRRRSRRRLAQRSERGNLSRPSGGGAEMSVGGSDGSGPCSRQSGTALDLELAEFARALTAEGELGLSTIRQYRSHLNSTVADSAQESVAALLAHPVDAVAAIRAPASQQARRCRHLVNPPLRSALSSPHPNSSCTRGCAHSPTRPGRNGWTLARPEPGGLTEAHPTASSTHAARDRAHD